MQNKQKPFGISEGLILFCVLWFVAQTLFSFAAGCTLAQVASIWCILAFPYALILLYRCISSLHRKKDQQSSEELSLEESPTLSQPTSSPSSTSSAPDIRETPAPETPDIREMMGSFASVLIALLSVVWVCMPFILALLLAPTFKTFLITWFILGVLNLLFIGAVVLDNEPKGYGPSYGGGLGQLITIASLIWFYERIMKK